MIRLLRPCANALFTMISYVKPMVASAKALRRWLAVMAMMLGLFWANAAQAQNCGQATSQGTAPANWQTYCWLNLANYSDATAQTTNGQNLSFTLPDGSVLAFNVRVTGGTGTAYNAVTAPSWSGAAVGNTAFIGIPGRPVLYTAQSGTRTVTLSRIAITPPAGASASVYSFIVADAESSNDNEALRISTNGGAWQLLDSVPPISGSAFPGIAGVGTSNVNITGTPGTVGGYILGSNSPTTVTVETVAGGLQGVMFAVRFASIRLQKVIQGTRLNTADQFRFEIVSTNNNAVITSGTTTGSGAGPFSTAQIVMSAGMPLTLRESMAPGSVSALTQYSSVLTCVNTTGPSRSSLPNNLATTNFTLGQLEFGEALVCTFVNGAPPRLTLRKALTSDGRRFAGNQFTVRIRQGTTVVASATSTGTGSTITGGTTGVVQLLPGVAYTLDEIAAGSTNLGNYTATMGCTNATSGTGTSLPNTVPGTITLRPGDVITCTITNARRTTALLVTEKSSVVISDPVNGTSNPKLIPGAIVEYAIRVRNVGNLAVDASSIVILDAMPANMAFVPGTPVTFTNGTPSSGLNAFNASTMVRYASVSGTAGPFTYTPVGPFDPNVRVIRIAPTGTMAAATSGTNQPNFTIRFRARVQ
jgi:uncharacterized repeat protein (TIGR01451 family)